MRRALEEFSLEGLATTVPLGVQITAEARFIEGSYRTDYLEKLMQEGVPIE